MRMRLAELSRKKPPLFFQPLACQSSRVANRETPYNKEDESDVTFLINQGFIGEIKMATSALHEDFGPYDSLIADTHFKLRGNEGGAAALFNIGSHRVDLLRWLIGSEVKRVVGVATRIGHPREYAELDDCVLLLTQFENGSMPPVDLDTFSPVVSNQTALYGTEGTI